MKCNSYLPGTALMQHLKGEYMVPLVMVTGNTLQLKFAGGSVKPLGHMQLLAPVDPCWPLLVLLAPIGPVNPCWYLSVPIIPY